jgi:glycosyltransferase involved in cell wall biosynthesis
VRILILNWRCPKHPRAGGAEYLTHEIAKRLVADGDSVEWFSASFPGSASNENLDGITLVREGRQWTVHWQAFRRYRKSARERFDVIIDEVNTFPFFAPFWAGVPVVLSIFQLAREVWWYESRFPLNVLGFALEPLYLAPYRHTIALTISQSTLDDLRRLGFNRQITIMPIGVDQVASPNMGKAAVPTFLYVGRLSPSKRIEHVLRAFAEFRSTTGNGVLWIVGSGLEQYQRTLLRLSSRLGIRDHVVYCGRVSLGERRRRMEQAHALLLTSVREGWGLVVTEANACGTPAIGYSVPGLRDSIRHGETGLLVEPTPRALAAAMGQISTNQSLYAHLAKGAKSWSTRFNFEETIRVFRACLHTASSIGGRVQSQDVNVEA